MSKQTVALFDGLVYDFASWEECSVCGERVEMKSDGDEAYPEWEGTCCGLRYQVRILTAEARVQPVPGSVAP